MTMPESPAAALPDSEVLLADIVDLLRHEPGARVTSGMAPAPERLAGLRAFYRRLGIELSDSLLADGVAALEAGRFAHAPPRGPAAALARLYVSRRRWGLQAGVVAFVIVVALAGYFLGYRPYQAARDAAALHELQVVLPEQIDDLYQQVFDETKVQTAADQAAKLRDAGKAAAAKGDRTAADAAIAGLASLRDRLDLAYTVHLVASGKRGFWTFPPSNSEATNYYIIVDAVDSDGQPLSLPIASDDTGTTTKVTRWGIKVPQYIYEMVMAGRPDQGLGPNALIGVKQDGFLDVDYAIPVLGGTLTQW
jgi:hypothetical protein